jgi:hypothetical protein
LVLGCALEKALRRAGQTIALETAPEALRPVRLVTLDVDGTITRVVTKPTTYAQAVLKAVGLSRLRPSADSCHPRSDRRETMTASGGPCHRSLQVELRRMVAGIR